MLHSFGGPDGAGATSGLLRDKAGAFYGTTLFGGTGAGTVFKLTPAGSGYVERVLYDFKGGLDGSAPEGMIERRGVFYGVTFVGGDPNGNGGVGWGTIYKLAHTKTGYVETVLYRFTGPSNAWEPNGPIVMDGAGAILGSSGFGGSHNFGTIFKLTPAGSGYVESVLYSFAGGASGQEPQAGLTIDKHGAIYGTTMFGGSNKGRPCKYPGCGIVFKLTPHGSSYSESVIYAFHGDRDGDLPYGALTVDDRTGTVFGTTFWGGTKGDGAVFTLTPRGSRYTDKILYSFKGRRDGFLPEGNAPARIRRHALRHGSARRRRLSRDRLRRRLRTDAFRRPVRVSRAVRLRRTEERRRTGADEPHRRRDRRALRNHPLRRHGDELQRRRPRGRRGLRCGVRDRPLARGPGPARTHLDGLLPSV